MATVEYDPDRWARRWALGLGIALGGLGPPHDPGLPVLAFRFAEVFVPVCFYTALPALGIVAWLEPRVRARSGLFEPRALDRVFE